MILPTYERRAIRRRLCGLMWDSDTTPTKAMMCVGAWLFAVGSWATQGQCGYAACRFMEEVMPWYMWAIVWSIYASVKTWRILDGTQRPFVAVVVNIVGAFLYGGIATATTIARWPFIWLSSFEIIMALAAWWVLTRTTINPGFGFRGD